MDKGFGVPVLLHIAKHTRPWPWHAEDTQEVHAALSQEKTRRFHNWVAVEELELSCHNPETILFAIYP